MVLHAAGAAAGDGSNGSIDRSARLTTTAPSDAATRVAAKPAASSGPIPPSTNRSASRVRQDRKTVAACSSSSGDPAETVSDQGA